MFRPWFLLIALVATSLLLLSDSRPPESIRLLAQADHYAMLYNWPRAAADYSRAESLFRSAGDVRNSMAAKFGLIWVSADGGINTDTVDDLSTRLEDPLVRSDSRLLLRGLVAKAVVDRNSNEAAAKDIWQHILGLAKKIGDKRWESRAKAEIGQILYIEGDVQAATRMIRDGIVSQFIGLDLGAAVHYSAMVGNGAVESGRAETGLQYADVALKTARFVRDIGFPYLAYQGKIRALLALSRTSEAQSLLREAVARARQEKNAMALAQLLIVGGTADPSIPATTAIEQLREAVAISEKNGFHHVFAWSTYGLAKLHRDVGNLAEAEFLETKAIEVMRRIDDKYHLPDHLALLADIEVKEGNFRDADELYAEAADVIDALLLNVNTRQLKSSLIATQSQVYVGHFELAATEFHDARKAFAIIERARARSLADSLRGESEKLSAGDSMTLGAREDINRLQRALIQERSAMQRQVLLEQLFAAEQVLWRDRSSEGEASRIVAKDPTALSDIQASLRADETLIEYVLSKSRSFAMEITRSGARVVVIPAGQAKIEALVDQYLAAIRARHPEAEFSQALFGLLFEPFGGIDLPSKLIIVPDGKLHLLPFDALENRDNEYVLQDHVVTYSPSGTVLHLLRKSPPMDGPRRDFLGVGSVVYSGVPILGAGTEVHASSGSSSSDFSGLDMATLPDLAGSREEISRLSGIVGGSRETLLGKEATEAALKSLPLADFRLIHLAVHGVADNAFPDRAALVLGRSTDDRDDGLLQAREIRELRLNAELVTLSACDTGTGHLLGQEGIASLERAFLMAGARAVIASRWTTDDTYTLPLMDRFYRHLIAGLGAGTALQPAKLDLIKEFGDRALPIYWAGFTLTGEASRWRPISGVKL